MQDYHVRQIWRKENLICSQAKLLAILWNFPYIASGQYFHNFLSISIYCPFFVNGICKVSFMCVDILLLRAEFPQQKSSYLFVHDIFDPVDPLS